MSTNARSTEPRPPEWLFYVFFGSIMLLPCVALVVIALGWYAYAVIPLYATWVGLLGSSIAIIFWSSLEPHLRRGVGT